MMGNFHEAELAIKRLGTKAGPQSHEYQHHLTVHKSKDVDRYERDILSHLKFKILNSNSKDVTKRETSGGRGGKEMHQGKSTFL